jgi:hypothetical protein
MIKSSLSILFLLTCGALIQEQHSDSTFTDPRDGNPYRIVQLGDLYWFQENLKYRTNTGADTLIDETNCGVFYDHAAAITACPDGWRLPTEKEVKALIKLNKRGKLNLMDTLNINLCGRIDNEKHTKIDMQNTYWLNEPLEDGYTSHWHTFGNRHDIHTHDVVVARRKFPVRCVCEVI